MTKRAWLVASIITFAVIVVWVMSSLALTTPEITPDAKLQKALEDIDPNFDQSILDQVRNVSAPPATTQALSIVSPSPSPLPIPSIISSPSSTSSAILQPLPSASPATP